VQIFRPAKTLVLVCDKPRQPYIGCSDRGNVCQTQFLDQPILRRPEGALDTTLWLRAVIAKNVDV
jgi:hypothetical protein